MARKPTVSIVGAGRVGGAIGVALQRADYQIVAASSRSRAGRQRAHRLLDVPVLEPAEVAAAGEVVFITVPDDSIADVAAEVAPSVRKRATVIHTSGATSVDALAAIRDTGAHVGSLHPLQTIPDAVHGADALDGSAVAVTCSPVDRLAFSRLARAWGGRPFVLSDDAKRIYHAAAVFASNYIVSSVWAAVKLFESIGIRNAADLLGPLVRGSVDNVIARGGSKAITGPVARGDTATIEQHIEALAASDPTDGAIADAYAALAKLTAALAGVDPHARSA